MDFCGDDVGRLSLGVVVRLLDLDLGFFIALDEEVLINPYVGFEVPVDLPALFLHCPYVPRPNVLQVARSLVNAFPAAKHGGVRDRGFVGLTADEFEIRGGGDVVLLHSVYDQDS